MTASLRYILPKTTVFLSLLVFQYGFSFSPATRDMKRKCYGRIKVAVADKTNENDVEHQLIYAPCNFRRKMILLSTASLFSGLLGATGMANAVVEQQVTQEELDALQDKPDIPEAPEERSGLVVLRVAEVAQFQEKILRAIVAGELPDDVKVTPMQFAFGNQILLKNSKIDGNMQLMIDEEIPPNKRKEAVKNAVNAMNTLQSIGKYAAAIQRDFKLDEMTELADMYLTVRINLNQLYEYLPQLEKDKYYGYFVEVTKYEKKLAEGTYNPDIDGILKFD